MLISETFRPSPRFLRSLNLERDFSDPRVLDGYVVTEQAELALSRFAAALSQNSTQRAWRVTGQYGSGKSSLALALAHIASGTKHPTTDKVKTQLSFRRKERLLPVLASASREPLGFALVRALNRTVGELRKRHIRLGKVTRFESGMRDDDLVAGIEELSLAIANHGEYAGLLVIVDELGKALEFSALHPEQQDVYLLQQLAELAARSGQHPIVLVGLLHQGVTAYAEVLSLASQREWAKVAARLEEIVLSYPVHESTYIIARALGVKTAQIPSLVSDRQISDMKKAIRLNLFGHENESLVRLAPELYPLHPTVIPVMNDFFRRFGQNERSLFSFLFGTEPFGLQHFAKSHNLGSLLRLCDFFDYVRANYTDVLNTHTYRTHWGHISSVLDSHTQANEHTLGLLKTIGILNLLEDARLPATEDVLQLAVDLPADVEILKSLIGDLRANKKVLHFRGPARGYCLWPHTSVNIEAAYQDARAAVVINKIAPRLAQSLNDRPIVARRHYITTGNLRTFEVCYGTANALVEITQPSKVCDGKVAILLCETESERRDVLAHVPQLDIGETVLVGISRPLMALQGLLEEYERWEWVAKNTPELNHDRYAAEEVSRQVAAARDGLYKRVDAFTGVGQTEVQSEVSWFYNKRPKYIPNRKTLLETLSSICDAAFSQSPHIFNELVNRQQLSSAAAAARMRLIDRVFSSGSLERLGFGADKKPPELSMYLSVLHRANLHRQKGAVYIFDMPPKDRDVCNISPAISGLLNYLRDARGDRRRLTDVLHLWSRPPFGIKDGLSLLLFAVFVRMHSHSIALYEDNSFAPELDTSHFMRMAKSPESFEVQLCEITGVKREIFDRIAHVLAIDLPETKSREILRIVRPLCQFAADLKPFVKQTQTLSEPSTRVRDVLLRAKEPGNLIFEQLPHACGIKSGNKSLDRYVASLRSCLDELRTAYPQLLDQIAAELAIAFSVPNSIVEMRETLAAMATDVDRHVTQPSLRAITNRLLDRQLDNRAWLEAIGSTLVSKPPGKWNDIDLRTFATAATSTATHLKQLRTLTANAKGTPNGVHFAMVRPDGERIDESLHFTTAESVVTKEAELRVLRVLAGMPERLAAAAAVGATWAILQKTRSQ